MTHQWVIFDGGYRVDQVWFQGNEGIRATELKNSENLPLFLDPI